MLKETIAVVVAGVAGTIANGLAAVLVIAPERIGLLLVPGRYAVGILVAAALPFLFRRLTGTPAWIAALIVLTIVPSLLAKLIFHAGAPWGMVLALNAVYAIAALVVYRIAARRANGTAA